MLDFFVVVLTNTYYVLTLNIGDGTSLPIDSRGFWQHKANAIKVEKQSSARKDHRDLKRKRKLTVLCLPS